MFKQREAGGGVLTIGARGGVTEEGRSRCREGNDEKNRAKEVARRLCLAFLFLLFELTRSGLSETHCSIMCVTYFKHKRFKATR